MGRITVWGPSIRMGCVSVVVLRQWRLHLPARMVSRPRALLGTLIEQVIVGQARA